MQDIPESEARGLLAGKLICVDFIWDNQIKFSPFTQVGTAGVVNQDGVRQKVLVKIKYYSHPRIKKTGFTFSVFKQNLYGLDRVYQLELKKFPQPLKNAHAKPHEHWGNVRLNAPDEWNSWSFTDALEHFCTVTNIVFQPDIELPELSINQFRLT